MGLPRFSFLFGLLDAQASDITIRTKARDKNLNHLKIICFAKCLGSLIVIR
ncbi:hypothetical protein BH09BAC3_BH09BAC3_28990 [soil metagenome]